MGNTRTAPPKPEIPLLMLVAIYSVPARRTGTDVRVVLGIRTGPPDDMARMEKNFIKQVRDRYPEFFEGMKPKDIRRVVDLDVYDTSPDRHGYPQWLGPVGYYT